MHVRAWRLELAGDSMLTASDYYSLFRVPSAVEMALLICLSNIFSSTLHVVVSNLKMITCCQCFSTWSHASERQKALCHRPRALVKMKKWRCTFISWWIYHSTEKKNILCKMLLRKCIHSLFSLIDWQSCWRGNGATGLSSSPSLSEDFLLFFRKSLKST